MNLDNFESIKMLNVKILEEIGITNWMVYILKIDVDELSSSGTILESFKAYSKIKFYKKCAAVEIDTKIINNRTQRLLL